MIREMHYADDLEQEVGELLMQHGIEFIHESEDVTLTLDFYLPKYNVYIEVKKFHADRIVFQMKSQDNVIAIQGIESVRMLKQFFCVNGKK